MYKAIKTDAFTLIPEIVEVDFEIRHSESLVSDWIYITKGGVTGYASAKVRRLVEQYLERSVFAVWSANIGTLNKYHNLDVPLSEIIKFLKDRGLITVIYEYGYPKQITWKDDSGFTTNSEEDEK